MDIKHKWNGKYSNKLRQNEYMNPPEPNERLRQIAENLKGETAIDIACGLGGNSIFLAGMGFEVTAVDISEVAVKYISEQVDRFALKVSALVADMSVTGGIVFEGKYDLAVITYYLDRNIFPKVKEIVKDQGFFFMETFYKVDTETVNQTISDKYKLESNELLKEFSDWKILFFEESEQDGRQTILCQK
ncbi:class I SAM-dependent methyltransferase [Heyndrickxia sp. MSNUG]|uniref:class I SAM-dependent methyltransferase n=1 Tax=Heyndrickxia sp. MSNUG TaxID=3136677 RepID=UPI003C2ADE61